MLETNGRRMKPANASESSPSPPLEERAGVRRLSSRVLPSALGFFLLINAVKNRYPDAAAPADGRTPEPVGSSPHWLLRIVGGAFFKVRFSRRERPERTKSC